MDTEAWVKSRVEAIVRAGKDVRQQVAQVVASAVPTAQAAVGGLHAVVRATISGGARAAAAAVSERSDDPLRQVVDGLGDGLAVAAQAVELTMREAGGQTARFAREDLARLAGAFRDVSRGFVDAVVAAASQASGHAGDEVVALRDHAAATLHRIAAPLGVAAAASLGDPAGVARETLQAGAAAVRGAAGALCTALGRQLRALGVVLDPSRVRKHGKG
jgi:hypothetical protein